MDRMVEHVDKELSGDGILLDTWTLWSHLPHDTNWTLDSYKQIADIKSIKDAVTLYENLPETIIKNSMLFLMRKGIYPTWEDPSNKNGGCFSFKINNKFVINSWKHLSYVLLGETLTNPELSNNINGITVSPKKNFCIIKIWLSNCDTNDPNILCDVEGLAKNCCIFKKHISD